MDINDNDSRDVINLKVPFEIFMQIFLENSNYNNLLRMFELGKPNSNHIFLAKMASIGLIKTIVTTNFDMLIEKALINEGLKENKDFIVYGAVAELFYDGRSRGFIID